MQIAMRVKNDWDLGAVTVQTVSDPVSFLHKNVDGSYDWCIM